jgi:glycosyltransferase involved in cell wall biosynthesis
MTGMRICVIGKYPPIQGGVSAQTYWMCRALAENGHDVFVVTNADEVEENYRIRMLGDDWRRLSYRVPGAGTVTARYSRAWDPVRYFYVPNGNPSVTKLTGIATEVVRSNSCDVIFAFYLEPYGIAASIVGQWTGVPVILRHAGSDRYVLMDHPDAGLAYREVLRQAAGVITDEFTIDGLGIEPHRLLSSPGPFLPREFAADGPAMDLNAAIAAADPAQLAATSRIAADRPVIGLYGKLGRAKGTAELIEMLDHPEARDWQLVLLGGGVGWSRVQRQLRESSVSSRVWRLPFVAPWRVGEFIRACTVMCYLENDFAVRQHRPSVVPEILACGAPLVVSREAYDKLTPVRSHAGDRVTVVESPQDLTALRNATARAIDTAHEGKGTAGRSADEARREELALGSEYAAMLRSVLQPTRASNRSVPSSLSALCPTLTRYAGLDLGLDSDLIAAEGRASATATAMAADESVSASDRERAQIEAHLLWMTVDTEGRTGRAAFPEPTVVRTLAALAPDELADIMPVASSLLRFGHFTIDVAAYVRALAADAKAIELHGCAGTITGNVLFQKSMRLAGRLARVSNTTARLLALSDGSRTFNEIRETLGIPPDRAGRLASHLDQLVNEQVLGLAGSAVQARCVPVRLPWLDPSGETP